LEIVTKSELSNKLFISQFCIFSRNSKFISQNEL